MTHRRWARLACALLLALGFSLAAARPARADNLADEADLQFQLGADAYEKADFKVALEHFLTSNRLVPNRNVLFNIARTYEQLHEAPDAYRYYVDALAGETRAAQVRRIHDALARVAPSVAVLKVITQPPGATVYLDRKDLGPRGNTPADLGLPSGHHKVIVELAGYETAIQDSVEVKVGKQTRVEMRLVPILGTVHVGGEPGAQVRIDSEDSPVKCTVPCSTQIPPGRHAVIVSKEGYQTLDLPINLPPRGAVTVRARMATVTGSVVVNTDIHDALITVDGQPSGFTPAVINVPIGTHTLRVTLSGFRPIEKTIVVRKGAQVKLDLQLSTLEEVSAASRFTESIQDAPASVTVITQQELRAMAYPTIAEAIRGIRGMYLSYDTSYDTIGVRGFSRPGDYGNRILVLVDGHPANDDYIWSSYVGYDGRVDIDDVERIEVVRGPGSVLYGTSAFFGVINLVTRSRDQPTHVEASLSTAGYGVGRAKATGYWRISKDAGVWTSVSGAHALGRDYYFEELRDNPRGTPDPSDPTQTIPPRTDYYGKPYDGWARGVDGFDAGMINGRFWWKSLTVQWFINTRKKTLPSTEYETVLNDPRDQFTDTRGFVEARFEPRLSRTVQLFARAHLDMYDFNDYLGYPSWQQDPTSRGSSRDTYRGRWGGLEARVQLTPVKQLRLMAGGAFIQHFETFQRGVDDIGPYVFDDARNPSRNDPFYVAAGYVNADITPVKALKITAGARLDYYESVHNFQFLDAFNPRLAFVIKPYPRGTVKILAGKAFRAPSVYELYYTADTQIGAPNLTPEQVYSGEVELSHRFTSTLVGTVAGYVNGVTNLIELVDVVDPRDGATKNQYRNSPFPVLVGGAEVEVRREWRGGWMLSVTGSVQKAQYLNREETLAGVTGADCAAIAGTETAGGCRATAVRDVPNSPLLLGAIKGAVPILGRTLMLMSRLTFEGAREDNSFAAYDRSTSPPEPLPAQGSTNPGLVWDLVFSGEAERLGVRWAVGAYNLMDWKYEAVPSSEFTQRTIVQNGRTFLASVTASF